jgi:hypothetical protein
VGGIALKGWIVAVPPRDIGPPRLRRSLKPLALLRSKTDPDSFRSLQEAAMKPVSVLGLSVGALLLPAVFWQSVPKPGPVMPVGAPAPQVAQTISRLPFVIEMSGRYVLGGGLTAMAKPPRGAEAGIVIKADHVDLDLAGYALVGAEGSTVGIVASLPEKRDTLYDVCVHGGSVVQWGGSGVDLSVVRGARLYDLHASANGAPKVASWGLCAGTAAVVRDCTAIENIGTGIIVGSASQVSDCLADRNGLEGFALAGQVTVRQCNATRNGHEGFRLDGGLCTLADCSAMGNGADGVQGQETASLRVCSAWGNVGSGFSVGSGSSVRECVAASNRGAGVAVSGGLSRIEGNHLVLNSGSPVDVSGAGNAVVGNTISAHDLTTALITATAPGGVYVGGPSALHVSIAGVGSLRGPPHKPADDAALEKDGGPLEPWANIVVE